MQTLISDSRLLQDQEWAARLMLSMEPWQTLGRQSADCLQAIQESFLAVARDSDGPTGFILWTTSGLLNGYIRTIAVSPAHQGRGLGQALIAHAEANILAQSPNVFLCVSSFNPRARALYERLGYKQVGRLENLLIPGHDEVLLRKAGPSWREFRQTCGGSAE
ncbi:GNAT family N-acetyltransferase [bacterium]|nr:GNAT family N-acetyltransferase [bacterium]